MTTDLEAVEAGATTSAHDDLSAADGPEPAKPLTPGRLQEMETGLAAVKEALGGAAHCLVVVGYLGDVDRDRGWSTEDEIADACCRHFRRYPDSPLHDTLHVVLDSRGGSLDSAYKMVLFLRRFADDLRVHVPRRAKSAATLLAVGADLVVMSPFAELGPLDTQIKDPRNPSKTVSALDCYQSVDYVREFGVQTLPRALRVLLAETQAKITLSELITIANQFALGSVTPMLTQVNALDFGAWGRTLKIGETYARALLTRTVPGGDERTAARIARKLVYGYTHHPYPIDVDEAARLGLDAALMAEDEYTAARQLVSAADGSRFVGFTEDVHERAAAAAAAAPASSTRPTQERRIPATVDAVAYDPGSPDTEHVGRDADERT